MTDINLVETLVELAKGLEGQEVQDQLSPAAKREVRKLADNVRTSIEEAVGELTAPILLSFYIGNAFQAALIGQHPMGTILQMLDGHAGQPAQPHPIVSLVVSYLARDLLAGRVVE